MYPRVYGHATVVKDPELAYSKDGKTTICKLRLAFNGYRKKDAPKDLNDALYKDAVAFDKRAEYANSNLRKGDLLYYEGELRPDNYTKDGQTVYRDQIVLNSIEPVERRKGNGATDAGATTTTGAINSSTDIIDEADLELV